MNNLFNDKIAYFPIFSGISATSAAELLKAAGAKRVIYNAGDIMVLQGEENGNIGIVVAGLAKGCIIGEDGAESSVTFFHEGELYGEILSGSELSSPVTVVAIEKTEVLLIPFEQLVSSRAETDVKIRFIKNLFSEIAHKYFSQKKRLTMLAIRPLQKRIMAYIEEQADGTGAAEIQLNREQLASYLCCDRAALCRELSALKKAGKIEIERNSFKIL